jgi:hypothetical protein
VGHDEATLDCELPRLRRRRPELQSAGDRIHLKFDGVAVATALPADRIEAGNILN